MRPLLATLLLLPSLAWAQPVLQNPVRCPEGVLCPVRNHVDLDPGPGRTDYTCGRLSYDGSTGTDIAIPNLTLMAQGIPVLAAADGEVLRIRDGMPDISIEDPLAPSVKGREAGNSVILDHGEGWTTQYAHLMKGSIHVHPGQRVRAGDPMALMGLSGNTEFPHLEIVVRKDGSIVDPYKGLQDKPDCTVPGNPLWSSEAATALAYVETALLAMGFAAARAEETVAEAGGYGGFTLLPETSALVVWADVMGVLGNEQETITIRAADGTVLHHTSKALERPYVSWFTFSGRKRPPEGWPTGPLTATYRLSRNGTVVVDHTIPVPRHR